jgi:hypothetical protein
MNHEADALTPTRHAVSPCVHASQIHEPLAGIRPSSIARPPRSTRCQLLPHFDASLVPQAGLTRLTPNMNLEPIVRDRASNPAPASRRPPRGDLGPVNRRTSALLGYIPSEPSVVSTHGILGSTFDETAEVRRVFQENLPRLDQTARTFRVRYIATDQLSNFSWSAPTAAGTFGNVYMGMWGNTRPVAVKAFKWRHGQTRSACRELAIAHLAVGCPFVCPVLGYTYSDNTWHNRSIL